ncbi:MAG TPA: hypothetical protein VE890_10665, partial [Thermoguttaceae bacterium]|nr:hypothetical protein [Thermoguttaceae bacterium]
MMSRPRSNNLRGFGRRVIAALVLGLLLGPVVAAARAQEAPADEVAPERIGKLIRITLPITTETVTRVERFVTRATEKIEQKDARPVLVFRFDVPTDQAEFAATSTFEDALKLARLIAGKQTADAWTVAYIPESIRGHAVLVAMACDDIVMAPDSQLGPVDALPEEVGPTEQSAYRELAERKKTIPAEVALWLLDPSREVWKVETEISREYVTPEGRDDLTARRTIESEELLSEWIEGPPGQFSGAEARQLGFVRSLASSPEAMAESLELPASTMVEDPSLARDWKAIRVDLKGPITAESVNQAQRLIEDGIRIDEVNFVCLWINSPGGSPSDSLRMAEFLANLDPSLVRTAAYVPGEARADAALIALACDDLLIHPSADLGGSGAHELTEAEIDYTRTAIQDENGPWGSRSQSLVTAIIDPKLGVFPYSPVDNPKAIHYLSEQEFERIANANPAARKWQKGMAITRPGEPLLVDGNRAVQFGLANATVEHFDEFKRHYDLQGDPTLVEPGWADFLIEALASPGVGALLLMIAFVAMYAELHAPGIGVGGFTAAICFLLYFWSHHLGGTAGWLEIVLFVAGVSCLLLEVFVLPGFGIFGLGGGLLVLASVILATQTFVVPHNAYQFAQLKRSLLSILG